MGSDLRFFAMIIFVVITFIYFGLKAIDKAINFTGEQQHKAIADTITPTMTFTDPKTRETVAVRIPAEISRSKSGGFTVRMPENGLMMNVDDTGTKTFWTPLKGGNQ